MWPKFLTSLKLNESTHDLTVGVSSCCSPLASPPIGGTTSSTRSRDVVLRWNNKYQKILIIFACIAFLGRIFLAQYGTYYNDLYTLQLWSLDLIRYGFENFYQIAKADYPPGYLYFLWFTGKVYYWSVVHLPLIASVEVIYKLPSIFTDIGCGIFVYLITKKYTTEKKALITALFFLFNPAIFADSTLWGQIESFLVFFILSSFYFLLQGKFWLSALLLAFGQTVKPIAILVLPIYLLYLHRTSGKKVILYLTVFTVTMFSIFIPFNKDQNLFLFVLQRHQIMSEWFAYITLNAFNFWAAASILIFGTIERSQDRSLFIFTSFENWGKILFISIYSIILLITYLKIKATKKYGIFLSFAITLAYLAMYMFMTRMRERHLFFGLSLLTLLLPILPLKKLLFIAPIYLIYIFNLYFAFILPSANPLSLTPSAIIILSLGGVGISAYILRTFIVEKPA